MKRFTKWLRPPFLQRLDDWLRLHAPAVWQTRGHWVLFYVLLISIAVVLVRLQWPSPNYRMDPNERSIEPTYLVFLGLILVWFWDRKQELYQPRIIRLKDLITSFLTYFLVTLCVFVIFPMTLEAVNSLQIQQQQYLMLGIAWRNIERDLIYVFIVSLLLFGSPFLSIPKGIWRALLVSVKIGLVIYWYKLMLDHFASIFLLSIGLVIVLLFLLFKWKERQSNVSRFVFICLWIFAIGLGYLFLRTYSYDSLSEIQAYLYGALILFTISFFLYPYIHSLSEKN